MKIDPHYQRQKDSCSSVDFSNVQIVHKFAGPLTSNPQFKGVIFFNVKYLENGTRWNCIYNGRLIASGV